MQLTLPSQRRLPIKVEVEAPMLGIAAARDILHLDVDMVLELIADRKLAWAWNIGLGKRRSEIRILARCLRGYQASNTSCNLAEVPQEEIIAHILAREKKPWIEGVTLKHLLACENDLIIDLVTARELAVMPGTNWRRGPGGSPSITRESVINFLKRRREPK